MHIKKVIKLLSQVLIFIALIMFIPTLLALLYREPEAAKAFLITIGVIAVFAVPPYLVFKKSELQNLSQRDGFLFTSLTWVFATAFGALPLVLSGVLPNYSDAFFEIISGFTTTGATRIDDVESVYKSILFWRSLTNWLGGMGIVVLFITILPALGSSFGAFNLMSAETVGPVKSKLTPKTKETAIILWLIYLGVTLLQTVLLLAGGLDLFTSLTISFSTVSTAGFCTKNASIGAFNSAYVDAVVTIFMLLASINFSLYYSLLKGKIRSVFQDTEFKVFVIVVAAFITIGSIYMRFVGYYGSIFTSLRFISFQVASVISTTGFSSTSFLGWPVFGILLLIMLMFVGGCAGSTGGGIKIIRHYVLINHARNAIKSKTHPNSVFTLMVNGEAVDSETITSIFTFFVLYIFTWLIAAFIIALSGVSIADCLSSTLLSIGNIGLGFGEVPFSAYPHWTNWVFSFLMLTGRLEIVTVYVLFSRLFWRK